MAWSYNRQIKIIPGASVLFSKNGISTSIGVKDVNSANNRPVPDHVPQQNLQPALTAKPGSNKTFGNIFSADPQQITSQNMQGVKETILSAHEQRLTLATDLAEVEKSLAKSKKQLTISYILLYGIIIPSVSRKIKEDISRQQEATGQIQEQMANSAVQLDFIFEDDLLSGYTDVAASFKNLCTCNKIWDLTSAYHQNRVVTRSAASVSVQRTQVHFDSREIPDIKANCNPLYFQNGNGADIYFYPNFMIVYSSKQNFAIIELSELKFIFKPTRFIEEEAVPADSKIIDRTWAKVNKNGTPDKRFSNNYQIPIVRYGNIGLQTAAGLNEEYEFSNYEFAEAFANAFLKYQNTIKALRHI